MVMPSHTTSNGHKPPMPLPVAPPPLPHALRTAGRVIERAGAQLQAAGGRRMGEIDPAAALDLAGLAAEAAAFVQVLLADPQLVFRAEEPS